MIFFPSEKSVRVGPMDKVSHIAENISILFKLDLQFSLNFVEHWLTYLNFVFLLMSVSSFCIF